MKKTLLLAGFLLMILSNIDAQIGFRPGYIIKNNGDSLSGQIFYGTESKFGKECLFKRFDIAQEMAYSADKLRAYGFRNGRHFESKQTGNRNSFFECLVKGTLSLYIIPGKTHSPLYIENDLTGFVKLNKNRNTIPGGKEFSNYKDLLSYLLSESGSIQVSANSTTYEPPSVKALITESAELSQMTVRIFHQTSKVNYFKDFSLTRTNPLMKVGFIFGYQFLTIDIPGDRYTPYFKQSEFNSSYRPVGGLFINQRLSRKSELVSIDLSLLYVTDSYYGFSEYKQTYNTQDDLLFDFSSIQVPVALKFTFGKHHFHPYIKAGGYKSFLLTQSYKRYSEIMQRSSVYTEYLSDFSYKGELGFHGAFGAEFLLGNARNVCLEAGFMQGIQPLTGTNKLASTKIKSRAFSILLKFSL